MSDHHSTGTPQGIILTRVSDDKQSGASSQLAGTRRLAKVHAVDVVAELNDDGISGDDLDRPGILEMFALLEQAQRRARPIGWILLDQADRLSRADSLETSELLLRMRRLGVRKVATPSRVYDLFDSMDRTLLQIEADHKNNPFLKDLGRRVLNGMLDTARAGFWTGQRPPLGYTVVHAPGDHGGRRRKSGRLVIDPETAPIVEELFQSYRDGAGLRESTRWLASRTGRRWTRSGVSRMLRNELYIGVKVFGKRTSGRHARLQDGMATIMDHSKDVPKGDTVRLALYPAIIDPTLFAEVGRMMDSGKERSRRKDAPVKPLTGMCRCGLCRGPLLSAQQKGYPYFRCQRRHDDEPHGCSASGYYRGDELFRRVVAMLSEQLLAGDTMARLIELAGKAEDEARAAWEARYDSASRSLDSCAARLARARRRLMDAPDDLREEYECGIRELKQEKADVEADLAKLREEQPSVEEGESELLGRWLESCRLLCAGEVPADGPAQNAMLRELVREVRVFPPVRLIKGKQTVGRIEVELPEWLSRVLGSRGGDHCQPWLTPREKAIVLVGEA